MRRRKEIGIYAGAAAALLTLGGLAACSLTQTGSAPHVASSDAPKEVQLAQAFLSSWAAGHYPGASSDTDDPTDAQQAMEDFHDTLHLTSLRFTHVAEVPDTPSDIAGSTRIQFQVTAQMAAHGSWSYTGALDIVPTGRAEAVHWTPAVLNSKLTNGSALEFGPVPPSQATVTDEQGQPLTTAQYPSLGGVLSTLSTMTGHATKGTDGTGIIAVNPRDGSYLATLDTFTPPRNGLLKTTLDANLQSVAEQAVVQASHDGTHKTGLVAVDPATGQIKAIAGSPVGGFNWALSGTYPPGATMELLTSAALLDKGAKTPNSTVPCPAHLTVAGSDFTNTQSSFSSPSATLTADLANSCDTAFASLHSELGPTDLAQEARNSFGIGLNWNIGIASADGQIPDPAPSDAEQTADLIGQGQTLLSPLQVASLGATIQSGTFRQPILLPSQLQQPAPDRLAPTTDAALRQMMVAAATQGTAAAQVHGHNGGAISGAAAVQGQDPDGWYLAYNDHLAVAAVIQEGGNGVATAGPLVAAVLNAPR